MRPALLALALVLSSCEAPPAAPSGSTPAGSGPAAPASTTGTAAGATTAGADYAAEDARRRKKAAELGLARADAADMEHVEAFLCNALLQSLVAAKDDGARRALAADVDGYGCRDRREWTELAVRRAQELGMPDAETASRRTLQAFVCGKLAEAARATAKTKDRAALDAEAVVHGCATTTR